MKRSDVQKLSHGLYRIYWRSGGFSLAAVGSTYSGTRWLAPANWTAEAEPYPSIATTGCWRSVERVELIEATNAPMVIAQ